MLRFISWLKNRSPSDDLPKGIEKPAKRSKPWGTGQAILACKDVGAGKMPSEDTLLDFILQEILFEKDLTGKNVLVTAGPTMEAIDPVRFISNHSTGKMGYAVAKTAARRGAKVTLVSGPVNLLPPRFVETVQIESAAQMYEEVIKRADEQDIIIKAAAVADYTPENTADEKIKKKDGGEMSIPLKRTKDILKTLGENKKENQFICGFSMETQNMLENSKKKLEKKNVDMIVANNLKVAGAGFGTDTNIVTLITKDAVRELPKMSKEDVAAAPGSVSQVRETTSILMQLAKGLNITIFIVGHVTKEGTVAGPRMLEHMVDTVLYFEGDRYASYRILRGVKNRFGSTNEIGVFEMQQSGLSEVENPSEYMLNGRPENASGSVVVCLLEGTRPIMVEIQALVCDSNFGMARRTESGRHGDPW